MMGHVFQDEWWGNILMGVDSVFYGLRNWQRQWLRLWKGKMAFLAHLFMKIKETRRKGR